MDAKVLDEILWKQLSSLPYFRGLQRSIEHSFYTELELDRPILDLGAGDGHFASVVFADPIEVGLDPWREPLQEAATRKAYHFLTQAVGDKMPFPDASFATVISNSVLEHIEDLDPVILDTFRVLKPGGLFVFCVPNQRFLTELWGQGILESLKLHQLAKAYNRFFNKIARHKHLDNEEVWIARLQSVGFEVVKHRNYYPIKALQMMERGHLFGLPNLLWKKTIGRWILIQKRWNPFIPWRKVRKFMDVGVIDDGTCTFYIARRPL